MKGILVYQPPDKPAQLPEFIDGLDPRLREKIIMQLYQLSKPHKPELREPHFKRFSLERYRDLCELRVKSKMLVRIIFYFCPNGQVLLLHGFIKRQKRGSTSLFVSALCVQTGEWYFSASLATDSRSGPPVVYSAWKPSRYEVRSESSLT